MSSLIKKYKSPSETVLTSRRDVFFSLCKSIIGQQISVAAANSVFLKFKKKCKNKINARTVNKLSPSQLKSCGLSRQKVKGIKSLAKQVLNKEFNSRLTSINWETYYNNTPFENSALALYKWAPIAEELKKFDKQIVLNSVFLKWNNVQKDFKKLVNNFTGN